VGVNVPFFRPQICEAEIKEVVDVLRSGWLTTGARVRRFEQEFGSSVGSPHAVALNSCTAALHLAVHALGLSPGQGVLVPTMTFAATAEVVRYEGGIPILVDCDPHTLNMNLDDAAAKIETLGRGEKLGNLAPGMPVVGIMPVHVAGLMMDIDAIRSFAARHRLWIVEDAAHAYPAAWRRSANDSWQRCGENTAQVTCFSFYANKTITTGEGGMATTHDAALADRLRLLSLHGLSHGAWDRYSVGGSWDYHIEVPGYKYNLTDIAAAIGLHQLARAEEMRRTRESIAMEYLDRLADVTEIELPPLDQNRVHAWHLFPIRLHSELLRIDRDAFIRELRQRGISCSVHWRPLHLHPYYRTAFEWDPSDLPAASHVWPRLVSLPLFSSMSSDEIAAVVQAVGAVCSSATTGRFVQS
jgi:dTDP-4-amino-4,6-dideoxygalactose transaminase